MSLSRRAVLALVLALGIPAASPAQAPGSVRIFVHIPLAFNDHKPAPPAERRSLLAALATLGTPVEHLGYGTYVDPKTKRVSVDPVDHVVVTTSSLRANVVVMLVLERMRRDLRQSSTLAEVVPDPRTWNGEEPRVQFDVRIRSQGTGCDHTCSAVRDLLDRAGGGDSEFDGSDGAHLMSSVPPREAARVRNALRTMALPFAERSSGFVLVTS